MNYLTKEEFLNQIHILSLSNPNHWGRQETAQGKPSALDRWSYHQKAIEILKSLRPASILEAGTLGIKVVRESDTIDLDLPDDGWRLTYVPTYRHDLRVIPWPIEDQSYDVFLALRVFHHLADQAACLEEMERVAKRIILALPLDSAKRYEAIRKPEETHHFDDTDTTILVYL